MAAREGAIDAGVQVAALAVSTVAAAIRADLVCLELDLVLFGLLLLSHVVIKNMCTFRRDLFNRLILYKTDQKTALNASFFRKSEDVISGGYRREFYWSGTGGIQRGYKKLIKH